MHLRLLLFCLREDKEVSEEDIGKIARQGDLGGLVRRAALLQHELQQEMPTPERPLPRPPPSCQQPDDLAQLSLGPLETGGESR